LVVILIIIGLFSAIIFCLGFDYQMTEGGWLFPIASFAGTVGLFFIAAGIWEIGLKIRANLLLVVTAMAFVAFLGSLLGIILQRWYEKELIMKRVFIVACVFWSLTSALVYYGHIVHMV